MCLAGRGQASGHILPIWYDIGMTNKLKDLIERTQRWPKAAQDVAISSLEAIEEDFVMDAILASDLKQARTEMRAGRGTPQEDLFERFGL